MNCKSALLLYQNKFLYKFNASMFVILYFCHAGRCCTSLTRILPFHVAEHSRVIYQQSPYSIPACAERWINTGETGFFGYTRNYFRSISCIRHDYCNQPCANHAFPPEPANCSICTMDHGTCSDNAYYSIYAVWGVPSQSEWHSYQYAADQSRFSTRHDSRNKNCRLISPLWHTYLANSGYSCRCCFLFWISVCFSA